MAFEPDIIATMPDGTDQLLVVEVKLRPPSDQQTADRQLKDYMIGMRPRLGMLVTPTTLRLFKDEYRGYTADSIDLIGEFELPPRLWAGREPKNEPEFEGLVQAWLEELRDASTRARLPSPLREAIEEHLAPVLRVGELGAAHERRLVSRASEPDRSR